MRLFCPRNQLRGEIPTNLGNLGRTLQILALGENQLVGEISGEVFGQLTNLAELSAARNRLQGAVPEELGRLTQLTALGLGANRLQGQVFGPEAIIR